jgi:hypothetical protein
VAGCQRKTLREGLDVAVDSDIDVGNAPAQDEVAHRPAHQPELAPASRAIPLAARSAERSASES